MNIIVKKKPNALATSHEARPKPRLRLIVPVGRSGRGKTFWSRWFVDQVLYRNRKLVLGDGDYITHGFSRHFPEAVSLSCRHSALEDGWFASIVDRQSETGADALIDFGPDISIVQEISGRAPLGELLDHRGIDLIMIFLFESSTEDLLFFQLYEKLLNPKTTILALNEGVVVSDYRFPTEISMLSSSSNKDGGILAGYHKKFHPVVSDPQFRFAVECGAQIVTVPRLEWSEQSRSSGVRFTSVLTKMNAEDAASQFWFLYTDVRRWLIQMDEAFSGVFPWMGSPFGNQELNSFALDT